MAHDHRTMAELEVAAMEIIKRQPGMRCGRIGDELFPNGFRGSQCSAPFARIAGKVMSRLQKQGRAMIKADADGWWGWHACTE